MPQFYYKAKDRKGVVQSGSIEAGTEWLARKLLNKQNLIVLEIGRFNLARLYHALNRKVEQATQKVTPEEKLVLMNQLETGFSVGIPIVQMLYVLQQEVENPYLKETLKAITEDVTQGSSLHQAMAKHPNVFDGTVVGLVKTGELTGKLEETLGRISKMIEQQANNRAKVKSAIFYPKIVLFVMAIVLIAVIYFVIPKLKSFLAGFGADLPPITQFVVNVSDFFTSYWYLVAAVAFGVRAAFKKFISTRAGKLKFDQLKLRAPVFGKIFLYLELNNFCVILELLISSGVPLMEALETLKDSQDNEVFKDALGKFQAEISRGGNLTKGMEGMAIFPSTFRNLLSMGEEAGRLQPVLVRLGRHYQTEIDYRLDNLSKLIEPILLFFIFGMVLVIALAVFLPIWKLNSVQSMKN